MEESVAQIRWETGGKHREPVRDGLIVAAFRHSESRAAQSKPHLHDHAVVSIPPGGRTGHGATCRRTRCWSTSSPRAPCTSRRRRPPDQRLIG
ncbi:relaxase domain-containing protein [Streptomyces sp. NPDC006638]|uniref:relaxase domain-containing protein n=1 Tax=Streptomyces sp. NPDC006638 TaxID=3157183 RepID=UPI0033A568FD